MKKILVPVDFSAEAENALQTAIVIAKKTGAELNLLHIVESANYQSFTVSGTHIPDDPMDNLFMIKLLESSKKKLEHFTNLAEGEGLEVNAHLKAGNVYSHISEIITSYDIDLIIMGTKGVTNLEDLVLGSNTEKVLRTAKCPVLTVKGSEKGFNVKNVVFAVDLHEKNIAPEFVKFISGLQKIFDFVVHIVYVNTPSNFKTTKETDKLLKELVTDFSFENYTLNVYNDRDEETGITSFAAKAQADLIAVTTHGRKGFSNMMWGSVSEDVVNQSRLPILVYKHKAKKSKEEAIKA